MGDFNRDRGSGGRSFGRRAFGGKSGDRQMFKTVCSKCNKECEVPFVPTGARPVFCSECFQKNRTFEPRRSNFEDRGGNQVNRPAQPQYQEQFAALNVKLDKILKILEPKIVATVASAEVPEVLKTSKIKKVAKKSSPKKKE